MLRLAGNINGRPVRGGRRPHLHRRRQYGAAEGVNREVDAQISGCWQRDFGRRALVARLLDFHLATVVLRLCFFSPHPCVGCRQASRWPFRKFFLARNLAGPDEQKRLGRVRPYPLLRHLHIGRIDVDADVASTHALGDRTGGPVPPNGSSTQLRRE